MQQCETPILHVSCQEKPVMSLIIIPNFITEDIVLLRAFFVKQEAQIAEFQDNLDKHIEVSEVERWTQRYAGDEGEAYVDEIEHIAGISDDDYNVRELFLEVMPAYQRQSMLLTLWGAFEYEIEKMCVAVGSLKNKEYTLPNKPKNTSAFMHLINELIELGVPNEQTDAFNELIKSLNDEVRHVRNAWAHNGGVDKDNKLTQIPNGISVSGLRLIISREYIVKVIQLMSRLSVFLNSSAQKLFIAANKASQSAPKSGATEL